MTNSKFSRRDPSREQQWRDWIDQQQQSGESVRIFCGSRNLRETSFYYWRREIALRDREAESRQSATTTLAPVVVVDEPDRKTSDCSPSIEIVLGDITVRVPCGATREQLAMVLAVLERSRC